MNVSHVALVMDASGNLLVYKNKGRPTSEEKRAIEINGDLNQELCKLKNKCVKRTVLKYYLPFQQLQMR